MSRKSQQKSHPKLDGITYILTNLDQISILLKNLEDSLQNDSLTSDFGAIRSLLKDSEIELKRLARQ